MFLRDLGDGETCFRCGRLKGLTGGVDVGRAPIQHPNPKNRAILKLDLQPCDLLVGYWALLRPQHLLYPFKWMRPAPPPPPPAVQCTSLSDGNIQISWRLTFNWGVLNVQPAHVPSTASPFHFLLKCWGMYRSKGIRKGWH